MMRAMDGVRTTRRSAGAARRSNTPVEGVLAVQPSGYVVGMDGIRRPVLRPEPARTSAVMAAPAPRPMTRRRPAVVSMPRSEGYPADVQPLVEAAEPRSFAFGQLPKFGWRRPAVAFGLVAMALIASTAAVRVLSTPQNSTARAASEQPVPSAVPQATPVPVVAAPVQSAGLQQILDGFAAASPGKFGIVVKNLATGETASIDSERQITSASLYKLFVAQRVYQQIDLGQLSLAKAAGSGTGRTIDQCLTIMINISDNECGRALGTILGWGAQDHALSVEGYSQTTLTAQQKTSAGDVARLFERLYNGTLVSTDSSQKFIGLLKDQRVNNRLPKGLPAGTVIAHKTGDLDGVVHDAGIVYGPKANYVVVVTSGPWSTPGNAPAQFADLSTKLWNYFEQ